METRNQQLLVIAIDKYRSSVFEPLNNAVSDSKLMIKVLQERYGFELFQEPLFDKLATRVNIYQALTNLVASLDDRDDLIIYFAGHGLQHTLLEIGYWIPYDATESADSFISNSEIKNYLSGMKARHVFLIADSCFSGTFVTGGTGIRALNRPYAELAAKVSRLMITAGGEEVVSDGRFGETSPFSRYLLRFWKENDNAFTAASELITCVTTLTAFTSRQRPQAGIIDDVGDAGGEMIFYLKDEYV